MTQVLYVWEWQISYTSIIIVSRRNLALFNHINMKIKLLISSLLFLCYTIIPVIVSIMNIIIRKSGDSLMKSERSDKSLYRLVGFFLSRLNFKSERSSYFDHLSEMDQPRRASDVLTSAVGRRKSGSVSVWGDKAKPAVFIQDTHTRSAKTRPRPSEMAVPAEQTGAQMDRGARSGQSEHSIDIDEQELENITKKHRDDDTTRTLPLHSPWTFWLDRYLRSRLSRSYKISPVEGEFVKRIFDGPSLHRP